MEVLRPDVSLRNEARCAMRGSCGPKVMFGKPLPCPYDGPPSEVRLLYVYTPAVSDTGFIG